MSCCRGEKLAVIDRLQPVRITIALAVAATILLGSWWSFVPVSLGQDSDSRSSVAIEDIAVDSTLNPAAPEDRNSNTIPANLEPDTRDQGSVVNGILSALRARFERRERPLGSRSWLCPYSPGLLGDTDMIWSNRPVFLWQASASNLVLYDYDSGELLWETDLDEGQSAITYDSSLQTLQPGLVYHWQLTQEDRATFQGTFEIMAGQQRADLEADLAQLDASLGDANASERAAARANFFGDRGLWSDSLQELHAVRGLDVEVDSFAMQLASYVCNAENPEAVALE